MLISALYLELFVFLAAKHLDRNHITSQLSATVKTIFTPRHLIGSFYPTSTGGSNKSQAIQK
jgi:hypothetical protein